MNKEIETVIEQLRVCSKELGLNCNISFADGNSTLILEFKEKPQPEIAKAVEDLVFFSNEFQMKNLSSIFTINDTKIIIRLQNYPLFCRLYETLKSFKANVFMVEVTKKKIVFAYTLKHKHDLGADELDQLQNLINPEITEHDSIRVCYNNGVSTLDVDLTKKPFH